MADPSRRVLERLPCSFPLTLHTPSGGLVADARFIDIGVGGAAVETTAVLRRRVGYEARFSLNGRALAVPARVAWDPENQPEKGPRRYGLLFTLTTTQEETLAAIVRDVRLGLWA